MPLLLRCSAQESSLGRDFCFLTNKWHCQGYASNDCKPSRQRGCYPVLIFLALFAKAKLQQECGPIFLATASIAVQAAPPPCGTITQNYGLYRNKTPQLLVVLLEWSWLPSITPLNSKNILNGSLPGTHADFILFAGNNPSQGFREKISSGDGQIGPAASWHSGLQKPSYCMEPNHRPASPLSSHSVLPQST